jgi:hypothetical protein
MDPYLEGELWQEFHQTLATEIRRQLNPRLRPKYVALLEKYYVTDDSIIELVDVPPQPTLIYPDVGVVKTGQPEGAVASAAIEQVLTPPSVVVRARHSAPQMRVVIRDVAARRLVTVIEILSRANKVGTGAREYLQKRDSILETDTHLMEIDWLRGGQRLPLGERLPAGDYYVYLNRADRRWSIFVWAIPLPQKLPVVPVPLLEPDADVPLDLQAALTTCFDLVGYDLLIDYSLPPPAPDLPPEGLAWVDALLRVGGVRPAKSQP